mgnify:CR=1 FL=1
MRSTLGRGNDIDERLQGGFVANPPPQRDVDLTGALYCCWAKVPVVAQLLDSLFVRTRVSNSPNIRDGTIDCQDLYVIRVATFVAEFLLEVLGTANVA